MSKAKAIPDGMTAVTPHLVVAGAAKAIDWYKQAFGATEEMRVPDPAGRVMHACIRIGGAAGDRYGTLEDPFGHKWSVATHIRDVTPEEIAAAMKEMAP